MKIGKAFEKLKTELSNYDEFNNASRESVEDEVGENSNDLENEENQNVDDNFQENLV